MRRFSVTSLPVFLTCLALTSAFAAPAQEKDPDHQEKDPDHQEKDPDRALLGAPLEIDDQTIPFDEIKRQVCLGALGQNYIEAEKLRIFTNEELEARVKAGKSREEYDVSDEDLAKVFKQVEDQLKEEYPGGEVGLDQVLPQDDGNRRLVRTTELFKKVYLPDNPADYCDLTVVALHAQENGDQLIAQMQIAYDLRAADAHNAMSAGERVFQTMLLQQIVKYLNDIADVVDSGDDLPTDILMRVNGKDIPVEAVWERIKGRVTSVEVRSAKQWITNMVLLEKALTKAGTWLSDEEAEAAYTEHSEPFEGSIFSIERLAVTVKRFPSVSAYKDYYRAYESFHRMMKEEMTPEALEEYGKRRTQHLIGQVSVDADVILLSAYDHKNGKWKKDGWDEAENKTREVLSLLVDDEKPWEQVLQQYSEFYDLPVPKSQVGQETPHWITDKGRFRNKQRNVLMKNLDENDYWLFLNGDSITDYIFFEQKVEEIGRPMKGPRGWYIPLLLRRSDPPARLSTSEENMKELIRQDYLNYNLRMYVRDLVRESEVYGIDDAM